MKGTYRRVRSSLLLVVSIVLSFAVIDSDAIAQTSGTFTPLGEMTSTGYYHSAVRLRDSRVLFVGAGASANIYDPATRTFTAASSPTTARFDPTATLLDDGRVLIAGGDGYVGDAPLKSTAEVYNPSTDTFTRVGDMVTPQIASTATLLKNGKVLIAGGLRSGCCPTQAAPPELFDPATGTFSLTGSYQSQGDGLYITGGPYASAVTLLADGRVLVAGEPNSEIYDSDTGTFSLTGSMSTPCILGGHPGYIAGRTATLLTNGKVLLAGGAHEDCGRFADAELYDPATGTFTPTGTMSRARDNHTATLLADGKVLITGRETQDCSAFACIFSGTTPSAEIYDPATGTFAAAGNMIAARAGHTATLLMNGTVLIAGGYAYGGIGAYFCCFHQAELYTPARHRARRRIAS